MPKEEKKRHIRTTLIKTKNAYNSNEIQREFKKKKFTVKLKKQIESPAIPTQKKNTQEKKQEKEKGLLITSKFPPAPTAPPSKTSEYSKVASKKKYKKDAFEIRQKPRNKTAVVNKENSKQKPKEKKTFSLSHGSPQHSQPPFEKGQVDSHGKRVFKATRKRQFVSRKRETKEKELNLKKEREPQVIVNPVPKSISIMETISVSDLAKKMNLKASDLLSKLMEMGTIHTINSIIDAETAQLLASEYNCEITIVSLYQQTILETEKDAPASLLPRAPIVTVMGHVDHGKTTLLDTIRQTNITEKEQGNITQHIGAYQVVLKDGKNITFLDTPGHAAFSLMRARGAQLTDIVILVIAADDGVKPQTKEAINHAREANVPIIVALNKMDSPAANVDKVYKELSEVDLIPEEWGGNITVCKISALKEDNIDDLLTHVILHAELLDLKANPHCKAEGIIIESRIEKGHGIVATVLLKRGTLKIGDKFLAGIYFGNARVILSDKGEFLEKATPSMPVEVIGLEGIPSAGDPFQVTENERIAKQISLKRQELVRHKSIDKKIKMNADTFLTHIDTQKNLLVKKIIIKGDVYGSVEAIKFSLEEIGNEEVKFQVISAITGQINESDIMLASASNADIIGFNVKPSQKVQMLAKQERVEIHRFSIIFDVIEKMKTLASTMLKPEIKKEKIGELEIKEIFTLSNIGTIAGSYVTSGMILKKSLVVVFRNNKQIAEDRIASLKRFHDNVNKVDTGYECGIMLKETHDLQIGDIMYIFEEKEITRNL